MPATPARRALIVEDDPAIRELLRLHLELAGFTLDETGDGRQAVRGEPVELSKQEFDLL